jgi:hypothetical protein
MKSTTLQKLAPLLIAIASAFLIAGCGGSNSPSHTTNTALASKVFADSAAQNLTEVSAYRAGKLIDAVLVDASRHLETVLAPTLGKPALIRIGNTVSTLVPKGVSPQHDGPGCYVSKRLAWASPAKSALPTGAVITSVSGHTIDFKTANDVTRGSFEFNTADLIVGEQATVRGVAIKYAWTYSYPATAPSSLVTKPPSDICSGADL